ncbi:hypothetical protein KC19_7G153200 [Ceratodon purpureus]|uniref:Cytochrome P450 n=1 Tax=Ceratodon purpureus TaxID=3225 RepID=A0A8T0HF60_CERPU|nr:hypothetical protein KC19_7G153200 [Ceratodon purpureus]
MESIFPASGNHTSILFGRYVATDYGELMMKSGVEDFLFDPSWIWLAVKLLPVWCASLGFIWWHHPRYGRNRGPTIFPVVGCLPQILMNLHRLYDWSTEELEKTPTRTMRAKVLGLDYLETSNPANVEYMLKTNFENYPKGEYFRSVIGDLLGLGIFNADGSLWKQQRKVAIPEFRARTLRELAVNCVQRELVGRFIPILDRFCDSNLVVDLQDLLLRFTFDTTCEIAFGADPGCLKPDLPLVPFAKAFDDAVVLSTLRTLGTFPPWQVKRFLNVGSERKLRQSISVVDAFAYDLIQTRRKELADGHGKHVSDLLSRFMHIADEFVQTPEIKQRIEKDPRSRYFQPSDLFLRDIVTSFILAGRDASAAGLSWFFWLLSSNPVVEANIYNEIQTILASREPKTKGDGFLYEELKSMHYLHAALTESMRLYPPVPDDSKESVADDVFPDGTFIPKGTVISFHIYAMGRSKSIWGSDCLVFRPERFLTDGVFVPPNPFDYPVFLGGPRMCLGMDMGMMQMKLVAATLICQYVFVVREGYRAHHDLSITMKILGGLPIYVRRREC